MGRKRDLSEYQKGAIDSLISEGFSQSYVAAKLNVNKSTISRFVNGKRSSKKNSGRKKMTSSRQDRTLKRLCLSNRKFSSTELAREWEESTGVIADPSTIRKRLRSFDLISRRMVKKPLLTRKQRMARVAWCHEHRHWTEDQWKNVFFSDESKIEMTYHSGNTRVRRYSWEAQQPFCQQPTVKHPASLMIWSGFSARQIGYLHLCESTVNTKEYVKILRTRVLPYQNRFFHGEMIFQDDSAPAHRSKITNSFKSANGITSLPWPSNSPDLNPVENLWQILKKKVNLHRPRTKSELLASIIRVWTREIPRETLQKLAFSMPRRIENVLKMGGGPTKY